MDIKQYLINTVDIILSARIKDLKLIRTFKSTIYSVNDDGTYTIVKDKKQYNVKNGLPVKLSLGQNVWVMIPHSSIKDMFIYAIIQ